MKKKIIIFSVIAAVIVAAGVAAYLLYLKNSEESRPKTIEGAWELEVNPETAQATPDEAQSQEKIVYVFSKPGEYGDGTYKSYYYSGMEEGDYKLSEKHGEKLIDLGTGEFAFKLEGSKLTITFPEQTDEQTGQTTPAQDYVFKRTKAPNYDDEHYSSYDTDEVLLKSWVTESRTFNYYDNDVPYTETVTFNDKGIMSIQYVSQDLELNRTMFYAYSAKDSELTFSPVTDKENKTTVSYKIDNDGNLQFTNDNTTSSMFGDAVFSDVIYTAQ